MEYRLKSAVLSKDLTVDGEDTIEVVFMDGREVSIGAKSIIDLWGGIK